MFSDEAPKTATIRHGVESQQRTVIRDAANRAVIENFVDKIDDPKALSEAIKNFPHVEEMLCQDARSQLQLPIF